MTVDVPRFDRSHVENWVYKIDKFFYLHRVDYATRLAVVAFHLGEEASTWYQWMERNGALQNWDVFLQDLCKRFGTSIYNDPLGRISKLTQVSTVAAFCSQFHNLMTRITGVPKSMFLNFFVWGL